jgi:hypothetical protein
VQKPFYANWKQWRVFSPIISLFHFDAQLIIYFKADEFPVIISLLVEDRINKSYILVLVYLGQQT